LTFVISVSSQLKSGKLPTSVLGLAGKLLLLDVGNTHTHVGLADGDGIVRQWRFPTGRWADCAEQARLPGLRLARSLAGAAVACVVPRALPEIRHLIEGKWGVQLLELNARPLRGLEWDYPRPETIGPDRLANALAARVHWGAPVLAVDAGTATTFDVVNRRGQYIGGAIAPGFALVASCLAGKTALLPPMKWREMKRVIGKNTQEAMLAGAVGGYCGLVSHLIEEVRKELRCTRLTVVATGGDAGWLARRVAGIHHYTPDLTLEGLRLFWCFHQAPSPVKGEGRLPRRQRRPASLTLRKTNTLFPFK